MAKYRPIATKPNGYGSGGCNAKSFGCGSVSGSSSSSMKMYMTFRQLPYLRNMWPHLHSSPTKTRKMGRCHLDHHLGLSSEGIFLNLPPLETYQFKGLVYSQTFRPHTLTSSAPVTS
uniref:Uncharacterized protein n=1 Tax=Lactuca sativa TaxID=4236 RepID=A0A9R1VQE2_LACSA|nr:hypothetical protein LSAT_V11C400169720 [Lactuca sativa]